MVAVSDYCATLPKLICRRLAADPRLKVVPAPVDLGTFPVQMGWHVRYRGDPAPGSDGGRVARAQDRYRKGMVEQPAAAASEIGSVMSGGK